jgi:hypothetical protein
VPLQQHRPGALVHVDADPEGLGHAVGGDVVMGRADPAGGEQVGVAGPQGVDRLDDHRGLVGHDPHLAQVDAGRGEEIRDGADILVLGATREDLIADHEDGGGDGIGRLVHGSLASGGRRRQIAQPQPTTT